MRLLLVQHGDSVSETTDPDRPLSAKGRRDVEELARALRSFRGGDQPRQILHSGKLRALQTAEILGEALGIPVRQSAGLDPLDPAGPFASDVETWDQSAIVVGHLPFLERLASLLVADREEPSAVAFQRGGGVCLEKQETRAWTILWTFMPDQPKPWKGETH